jgi:hypothetical protein
MRDIMNNNRIHRVNNMNRNPNIIERMNAAEEAGIEGRGFVGTLGNPALLHGKQEMGGGRISKDYPELLFFRQRHHPRTDRT